MVNSYYHFSGNKLIVQKIELKYFKDIIDAKLSSNDKERPVIVVEVFNSITGKPLWVDALLDTGSDTSYISDKLPEALSLKKISNKKHILPLSKNGKGVYAAQVIINKSHPLPIELNFGSINMGLDRIKMVIGTDILSNFEFVYNIPKKCFSLKYIPESRG